jgi:pimeloyl-ACP methyl ester carboxylesterase
MLIPVSPSNSSTALPAALSDFARDAKHGTLDTGRYRMRFFAWGQGPPIVFIHGMADIARSFILVMHRLVGRYTCIAYDLPDGVTDGSAIGRYSLHDYTADLLTLLDHCGHQKAAVVGSSFGSLIALHSLATASHRCTKAILQGGFACRPFAWWEYRLAQLGRFLTGWYGDWPAFHEEVMRRVEQTVYRSASPEMWRFFVENHARTTCRAAAFRSLTIARTDLRPSLPRIQTPLLMIGGDCDPLVPLSCEKDVERGVPGARRIEIGTCGHYPQYTHPAVMAEAIAEFLGSPP